MQKRCRGALLVALGSLWAVLVGAGLKILANYETGPGEAGEAPLVWPAASRIERHAGRATLVMAAHPRCPCTRASIRELALLMAGCQGRVTATVLFIRPAGFEDGWERSDLWDSASAIPGVTVRSDDQGVEARRFGAKTSGQAVLYDADGRLLFSGGITGSRGHSGDNAGRSAIVALLTKGTAPRRRTSAFGCPLESPARPPT